VTLHAKLQTYERQLIEAALAECGGNRRRAAAHLGISLRTLFYRMRAWKRQRAWRPQSQQIDAYAAGIAAVRQAVETAPLRDDLRELFLNIVKGVQV